MPAEKIEEGYGVYDKADFGRVITAMVTPFYEDESLNLDMAQELAVWLENNGSEGLVVAGTTGEAPTLSHDEQFELIKAVHEAVAVPILAGTGSNNTDEAVEFSRRVSEADIADGLLVVSPYYNKPGPEGMEDYFRRVARATELPVIMYDIPGRTGRPISVETILRLAKIVPNIKGLKDAAGDKAKSKAILSQKPDDFEVYSGDDSRNLELYLDGAVGAISVASHWAGSDMAEMFDALDERRGHIAGTINTRLQESYAFETSDETPNPIPAKAMMRYLGLQVGEGRSPMILTSKDTELALDKRAEEVYDSLQKRRAADQV